MSRARAAFFCLAFGFSGFGVGEGSAIPVLCYHQVVPNPQGLYQLSCASFREQIFLMKSLGYTSVNSKTLMECMKRREEFVRKTVLLTFDDGFKSVYDYAFPIMRENGFVGVVCVYPQYLNSPGALSWSQIGEMVAAGWSVECHSMTHANLYVASSNPAKRAEFYETEIVRSRRIIRENTGEPVDFIAWPYGIYTEETEKLARKEGYFGAFTVDGGGNTLSIDPFRIKRQVVYRTDTREKFLIRLEMGSLEVAETSPRPGEVVPRLSGVECFLPGLADFSSSTHVLNAKITGGTLEFSFDRELRKLSGSIKGPLKRGHHFIDIYLRDLRTGMTGQNGWFFTLE